MQKKKSISKRFGNENGLYAGLGSSAFVQGKKSTFCIGHVKSLVIVSKCWHRTALLLVLRSHQNSQEFRTVGDAGKLTASEAAKKQLDETSQGKALFLGCRINLKTTFLCNDFSCIFKMYIEKAKLWLCLISKDQ